MFFLQKQRVSRQILLGKRPDHTASKTIFYGLLDWQFHTHFPWGEIVKVQKMTELNPLSLF
jgi:hypothetical protein